MSDKPKLNLRGDKADNSDSAQEGAGARLEHVPRQRNISEQPFSGKKNSLSYSERINAGDVLKDRGKRRKAEISEVWDDLRDIQLQSEESLLANREVKEIVGVIKTASKKVYKRAAAYEIKSKTAKNPSGVNAPRQRPVEKEKSAHRRKWSAKQIFQDLGHRGQAFAMVAVLGLVLLLGNNILSNDSDPLPRDVNGVSSDGVFRSGDQESGDLVAVEDTAFDMIFPSGKSAADFKTVRVSPPENDPAYAYVDMLSGVPLNISQQQVPDSIRGDITAGLKDLAASFNANDIIRVDDYVVYYGYSESAGGVQSLIFIKNDLLVFISSPTNMSDDVWANYVSRLN